MYNYSKIIYNLTQSKANVSNHTISNGYFILQELVRYLNLYYLMFVILIGLIGNSITIVIFWRTKLTHTKKTSFYLISLAINDIGFLIILLFKYLDENEFLLTFSKHSIACKLSVYICYIFSFLSCSLIFTFTLQRLCVICFPLRVNYLNLERRSKILIIILFIFACFFYGFSLVLYDTKPTNDSRGYICTTKDGYENMGDHFNFMDSLFTLIIPFFGLLIMNVIIIQTLKNSSYNFVTRNSSNRHFSYEPQNTNNNKLNNNLNKQTRGSMSSNHGYSNLPIGITAGIGLATDENNNNTNNVSNKNNKENSFIGFRNGSILKKTNYMSNLSESKSDHHEQISAKFDSNDKESVIISKNNFVKYICSNDSEIEQTKLNLNKILNDNDDEISKNNITSSNCFNCDSFRKCKFVNTKDPIFSSNRLKSNQSIYSSNNKNRKGSIEVSRLVRSSVLEEKINSKSRLSFNFTNNKNFRKSSGELLNLLGNGSINSNSTNKKIIPLSNKKNFLNRTSFRIGGTKTNSVSRKVTKMLIMVSSTFLLLNLPAHSINVYIYIRCKVTGNEQVQPIENSLREILYMFFYTSFSCNFLLYSISGVTFRTEFKSMFFKLFRIKSKSLK